MRFFVFLFITLPALAQEADTSYIQQFEKQNNIQINSWVTDVDFSINPQLKNRDFAVRLSPNVRNQIGVAFGLKKVTLFLGGQIPGTESNTADFGKTKYIDFSFGYFKKHWGGEIYYRKFNGLYRDANDVTPRTILPDARLTNYGLNIFYTFNRNFSFRSTIAQQELQRKSAGSLVLLANAHNKSLVSPNSVIPTAIDTTANFGSLTGLNDIRFYTLNIRPGYGYNFVFKNGLYFVSPSAFVGLGLGSYEYRALKGIENGFAYDLDFHAKLSAGFNHSQWFGSFFMMYDRSRNIFETRLVSLQTISYGINIGYRLQSFFGIKWL